MKVAIAFLTKDRTDLSAQSITPLVRCAGRNEYQLFWIDGSITEEGKAFPQRYPEAESHYVTGGPDAAIVFALSHILNLPTWFSYIGVVENDVLLPEDWYFRTMELFERWPSGIGAVSLRTYEDRMLVPAKGYAVMHNLGSGHVVWTRQAAELLLANYRTSFTAENRQLFPQLSHLDIGRYWAFKTHEHWITADWGFDRVLAAKGLASVAAIPSPVKMLDQDLAMQGLRLVDDSVGVSTSGNLLDEYQDRLDEVRNGRLWPETWGECPKMPDATRLFFPHQARELGGEYEGGWSLRWSQAFGPFSYVGSEDSRLTVDVSGPVSFVVEKPECWELTDTESGLTIAPPEGPPGVVMMTLPGQYSHRLVVLRARKAGGVFQAMQTIQPQLLYGVDRFSWKDLPPPVSSWADLSPSPVWEERE